MLGVQTHPEDGGDLAVCQVALASGVALVDPEDLDLVAGYTWFPVPGVKTMYARSDGPKPVLMHRLVTGAAKGVDVDHVNGNGLDNRRSNLRPATRSQNTANAGRYSTNRSGYKGVSWKVEHGKWSANIRIDGRQFFLGYFADPWDAAQAYNAAALEAWGDFAYRNERLS